MLWKDIAEDECCDNCPLLKSEICSGGFVCYGGEPVEPPCCNFDDDTDLDKWVRDYFERKRKRAQWESKQRKAELEKKERARKASETRREMQWYCRKEIKTLKQAQKALDIYISANEHASAYANAVNFANEMFGYEQQLEVRPEIADGIKFLKNKVRTAKTEYDAKRKEFYQNRKRQGSNGFGSSGR